MTESQIEYRGPDWPIPDRVILLEMTLTRDEIKLILRVRDAAATGQMILVDPDSMTWRAVGKLENAPRR